MTSEDRGSRAWKGTALVVLGMHRSGTSAVAGALHHLGVAAPRTPMPAQPTNPRGFWESDRLVPIHEELLYAAGSAWHDWRGIDPAWFETAQAATFESRIIATVREEFDTSSTFVIKDPRICRLLPLWRRVLEALDVKSVAVQVLRNPLDVAHSLGSRDGFPVGRSLLVWLRHFLEGEFHSRSMPRAAIRFDDLLADWRRCLEKTARLAGVSWPPPAAAASRVDAFLTSELQHSRSSETQLQIRADVAEWVKASHAAAVVLVDDPTAANAMDALDRVRAEFEAACPAFGHLFALELDSRSREAGMAEGHRLSRLQTTLDSERSDAAHLRTELRTTASRLRAAQHGVEARDAASVAADLRAEELRRRLAAMSRQLSDATRREEELQTTLNAREAQLSELHAQLRAASPATGDGAIVRPAAAEPEVTHALVRELVAAEFDLPYYRSYEPTVGSLEEAVEHFLDAGWRMGRDPNREFSVAGYLRDHDDVRKAGVNPFAHYLLWGRAEGRTVLRPVAAAPAVPSDPVVRASAAPSPDEMREVIAPYFDSEFYRAENPDLAQIADDPLDHYIHVGWHEGRDPSPSFSTSHYLQAYADIAAAGINPLYHYVVTGKGEGREAQHPGGWRAKTIARLRPVDSQVEQALRWSAPPHAVLSGRELARTLRAALAGAESTDVVIAVSHDDYRHSVGGVQLCMAVEARTAAARGVAYLNLHPARPLPFLARSASSEAVYVHLVLDGIALGTASWHAVADAVRSVRSEFRVVQLVVHSVLGHAPEAIAEFYRAISPPDALFWVHDFSLLCANYNLLRNNVAACGAPPLTAAACAVCVFGEERATHAARLQALFDQVPFAIVAPSAFAAEYVASRSLFPMARAIVRPHCVLEPDPPGGPVYPAQGGPVRVAFLGHPTAAKGWHTFMRVVECVGTDARYEFHHLGSGGRRSRHVHFTDVSVAHAGAEAMIDALCRHEIDVVLLWSIWPETFCIAAHEALAAGAIIVTGPDSGNIVRLAHGHGGHVLPDEDALVAAVADGWLWREATAARARRPSRRRLRFGDMSLSATANA